MIQITPNMLIYVAIETIDFRKGIDGLAAACRQKLQKDPFSGALFLFRNQQLLVIILLEEKIRKFNKNLLKGNFINKKNSCWKINIRG
jgi:transposase